MVRNPRILPSRCAECRPGLVVLRSIRGLTPEIQVADLGVAGYLTPPIDGPNLLRRLARLLRRTPRTWLLEGAPTPGALGLVEAALVRLRAADGARLSVGDMAVMLGVPVRRLRTAAREAYGVPMKTLMLRARVQHALAQLRETEEPIKAIAAELGFHDAAHLAHTVRRVTGESPRRHRERGRAELRQWVGAARATEQASLTHEQCRL
jgi:AraC-like DNA-binding protein